MNPYLTFCIACYAAIVSSLVLWWDITKWRSAKARLVISIEQHSRQGVSLVGGSGQVTWNTVNVRNVGSQTTTIKRVSLLRRSGSQKGQEETFSFRNMENELPCVLEPGKQWDGYPNGIPLMRLTYPIKGDHLLVYHSMGDKPAFYKFPQQFIFSQ